MLDTHLDREHTRGGLNVGSFGASGRGDDTAFIQDAINVALAEQRTIDHIILPRRHRITRPLVIDRLVDTTLSEFRIVGSGSGSGLYTEEGINFFDSTLPGAGSPQSEAVTFEGVQFEADAALGATLMTQKFLRMKFLNCNFRGIRCVSSGIYLQSLHFIGCNVRGWGGNFIAAPYAYDIRCIGNTVEHSAAGGVFFRASDGVHPGALGCAFLGNLFEDVKAGALQLGGSGGTSIIGNYFELNGSPSIHLFVSNIPHAGLSILGNHHSTVAGDAGDYAIYWGVVDSAVSGGNWADGRLHNISDSLTRGNIKFLGGDEGTLATWSVPPHDALAGQASADRGDTSQTLTVGSDYAVQRWATALTANRTVTLSTANAVNGDTFRIVRTGLGAFTLTVQDATPTVLKIIPAGTAAFVDAVFDGAAWRLAGYGAL